MKNITVSRIAFGVLLILWNLLFFEQNPGLNVLLFALINLGILLFAFKPKLNNTWLWLGITAVMLNALAIALYGNNVHIKWFAISILITYTVASISKKSIFTTAEYLLIKVFAGPVLGLINSNEKAEELPKSNFKAVNGIIGGVVVVVFYFLYSMISDRFSDIMGKLIPNVSFTSIGFLLMGALVIYPWIFKIKMPQPMTANFLGTEIKINTGFLTTMNIILILLNLMLGLVLLTNGYDLIKNGETFGRTQLHSIVDTSIASIILAIVIIIVGDSLIRQSKNKSLLIFSYLFLALNVGLVVQAFLQNTNYILGSEITPKRIGVYFFLALISIGLILTFIKIQFEKSLLWLINNNAWVALFTISTYNVGPWDYIVADSLIQSYQNQKLSTTDFTKRFNTLSPFVFIKMEALDNKEVKSQESYLEMEEEFRYSVVNSRITFNDFPSWSLVNYYAHLQDHPAK